MGVMLQQWLWSTLDDKGAVIVYGREKGTDVIVGGEGGGGAVTVSGHPLMGDRVTILRHLLMGVGVS